MSCSKQTYVYKTVENCQIHADVFRKPGGGILPVLLWIHGGALISGSRHDLPDDQLETYLDAGFVVVAIDYRLAPETKLRSIIEDLQDAHRWVRSDGPTRFGADADQVVVVGQSAGGYLTLMAGFCAKPRPRALVSISGYGDVSGPWYSRPDPFYNRLAPISKADAEKTVGKSVLSEGGNDRYPFYFYCRQQGLWPRQVAALDPDVEPLFFDPFCPVRNVTADYPPTLLLHGDHDTDVPYQESVDMANALKFNHVEHELITIPNGGHGFETAGAGLNDPANAVRFARVTSFLKTHLRDA